LAGSTSNLGAVYFVTLEAVNARNEESLGREFEQANSKEEFCQRSDGRRAASGKKLGESLSSIQKYDIPIEITTSSFEALKYCSLGRNSQLAQTPRRDSVFTKSAEFDPGLATAYSVYRHLRKYESMENWAAEMATKAFELRESVVRGKTTNQFFLLQICNG
jgi:transposase-like protein